MLYLLIFFTVILAGLAALAYLGSNYLMARRRPDAPASPADYQLPFEDVEFQASDGLTLRGWYIPARSAAPAPTVIVCPGANGSIDADTAVLPWFHFLNLNVLTFDWRGHGRSDGQRVTLGLDERYDLLAAVDFARSRSAAKVGVLGFSMGGAVAISTAAVCPGIDAVAADSPFIHVLTAVAVGLRERGLPDSAAYSLARLLLTAAGWRTGRDWQQADPARWIDRVAPKPLLLMFGELDPFAPRAEVDLLWQRAGEPKELWRVPDAAHRQLQTRQPEAYRRRITDFFVKSLSE